MTAISKAIAELQRPINPLPSPPCDDNITMVNLYGM